MNQGPSVLIWNRILVAVDEKAISLEAVDYVAAVLSGSANCRVDLLAVLVPPDPDNFPDQAGHAARARELEQQLQQVLARGERILLEAGLERQAVASRLVESEGRRVSEVIMEYQAAGGYGTVVVGRRGLSKAEEFLLGSVSSAVMHQAADCCVWVVG